MRTISYNHEFNNVWPSIGPYNGPEQAEACASEPSSMTIYHTYEKFPSRQLKKFSPEQLQIFKEKIQIESEVLWLYFTAAHPRHVPFKAQRGADAALTFNLNQIKKIDKVLADKVRHCASLL